MSGITVHYDNIDLIKTFNDLGGYSGTVEANKNIASPFSNNYQEQGGRRYGQQFLYNTLSVKQITLTLRVIGNNGFFSRVIEVLGGILNVTSAKPLVFGDEPNKVWEAIPSGQPTISYDQSTSPATATITITFDVPKAYAESKAGARVATGESSSYGTITKVSNNHYKLALKNNGTAVTYPKIRIKHNSDNGWVGIVKSATESFEIGNPNEADTKDVKKSEILFDYAVVDGKENVSEGLERGLKNVATTNDKNDGRPTGTLGIDNVWGRPHIALRSGRSASLTWNIPADSNNEKGSLFEYFWWRQIFWAGAAHQMGMLKITVHTESGEFLYGVETYKRENGIGSEYNFLASDGKGGFRILDRRRFECTHVLSANPFNETNGCSDILRSDDFVQFHWFGTYPQFNVPEIKGKKSAKINITFGRVGNADLVTHIYLDRFFYRKDYIKKIEDLPNRFRKGGVLDVDMAKGKTLIDNLPVMDELTYLSEPFGLDRGDNEIDIYTSSWNATEPTIEVTWKERFV